ncbi:MAG: MltA domain-containing protein [Nitrospinota bacterium]|nr:MltA domain-containing protein [Nitrospinota bacterium]
MPRFPKIILINFLLVECLGILWQFQGLPRLMEKAVANSLPNAPILLVPTPPPSRPLQGIKPDLPPPPVDVAPPSGNPVFLPLNFSAIREELPAILADDLDKDSLVQAIENHLVVLQRQDLNKTVTLGSQTLTLARLKITLEEFLNLLQQDLSPQKFSQQVKENFAIYQAGNGEGKRVLFTGYYTPIIPASRFPSESYDYPIYQMPESLTKVRFVYKKRLPDGHYVVFRLSDDGPNFTREDIDGHQILKDMNLEIAWLKNDLERYFLHIQGSGILEYLDGTREGVRYAGSNGYSYKPIGKTMFRDGVLPPSQGSMQGIKKYFADNPHDIQKYLFRNKRYVFFELTHEKPRGSSGAEVVGGRSIASDPLYYPPGTLGFMVAQKPELNDNDEITGWKKFSRFMVNQDTGSAIKGPNRMDLYFGVGNRAGVAAGHYMEQVKVFFLVKK